LSPLGLSPPGRSNPPRHRSTFARPCTLACTCVRMALMGLKEPLIGDVREGSQVANESEERTRSGSAGPVGDDEMPGPQRAATVQRQGSQVSNESEERTLSGSAGPVGDDEMPAESDKKHADDISQDVKPSRKCESGIRHVEDVLLSELHNLALQAKLQAEKDEARLRCRETVTTIPSSPKMHYIKQRSMNTLRQRWTVVKAVSKEFVDLSGARARSIHDVRPDLENGIARVLGDEHVAYEDTEQWSQRLQHATDDVAERLQRLQRMREGCQLKALNSLRKHGTVQADTSAHDDSAGNAHKGQADKRLAEVQSLKDQADNLIKACESARVVMNANPGLTDLLHGYFRMFKTRVIYAMLVTLSVLISIFSGVLMQAVFGAFVINDRDHTDLAEHNGWAGWIPLCVSVCMSACICVVVFIAVTREARERDEENSEKPRWMKHPYVFSVVLFVGLSFIFALMCHHDTFSEFVALPIMSLGFSLICDKASDLIIDGMSDPPFVRFQSTLLAALQVNPEIDPEHFLLDAGNDLLMRFRWFGVHVTKVISTDGELVEEKQASTVRTSIAQAPPPDSAFADIQRQFVKNVGRNRFPISVFIPKHLSDKMHYKPEYRDIGALTTEINRRCRHLDKACTMPVGDAACGGICAGLFSRVDNVLSSKYVVLSNAAVALLSLLAVLFNQWPESFEWEPKATLIFTNIGLFLCCWRYAAAQAAEKGPKNRLKGRTEVFTRHFKMRVDYGIFVGDERTDVQAARSYRVKCVDTKCEANPKVAHRNLTKEDFPLRICWCKENADQDVETKNFLAEKEDVQHWWMWCKCVLIDCIIIGASELVPLIAAGLNIHAHSKRPWLKSASVGYTWGLVVLMLMGLAFFAIAKLVIGCRAFVSCQFQPMGSSASQAQEVLERIFRHHQIYPGQLSIRFPCMTHGLHRSIVAGDSNFLEKTAIRKRFIDWTHLFGQRKFQAFVLPSLVWISAVLLRFGSYGRTWFHDMGHLDETMRRVAMSVLLSVMLTSVSHGLLYRWVGTAWEEHRLQGPLMVSLFVQACVAFFFMYIAERYHNLHHPFESALVVMMVGTSANVVLSKVRFQPFGHLWYLYHSKYIGSPNEANDEKKAAAEKAVKEAIDAVEADQKAPDVDQTAVENKKQELKAKLEAVMVIEPIKDLKRSIEEEARECATKTGQVMWAWRFDRCLMNIRSEYMPIEDVIDAMKNDAQYPCIDTKGPVVVHMFGSIRSMRYSNREEATKELQLLRKTIHDIVKVREKKLERPQTTGFFAGEQIMFRVRHASHWKLAVDAALSGGKITKWTRAVVESVGKEDDALYMKVGVPWQMSVVRFGYTFSLMLDCSSLLVTCSILSFGPLILLCRFVHQVPPLPPVLLFLWLFCLFVLTLSLYLGRWGTTQKTFQKSGVGKWRLLDEKDGPSTFSNVVNRLLDQNDKRDYEIVTIAKQKRATDARSHQADLFWFPLAILLANWLAASIVRFHDAVFGLLYAVITGVFTYIMRLRFPKTVGWPTVGVQLVFALLAMLLLSLNALDDTPGHIQPLMTQLPHEDVLDDDPHRLTNPVALYHNTYTFCGRSSGGTCNYLKTKPHYRMQRYISHRLYEYFPFYFLNKSMYQDGEAVQYASSEQGTEWKIVRITDAGESSGGVVHVNICHVGSAICLAAHDDGHNSMLVTTERLNEGSTYISEFLLTQIGNLNSMTGNFTISVNSSGVLFYLQPVQPDGLGDGVTMGRDNFTWNVTGSLPTTDLPLEWTGLQVNASIAKGSIEYAACRQFWGSEDAKLSALDLAALSWNMYENSTDLIGELLNTSFPSSYNASMVNFTNYTHIPRWAHFHFPPRTNASSHGTHVIAVKGTSTRNDAFIDTSLYSTIKVLQIFAHLTPVLDVLPGDQVQWMLAAFNLPWKVAKVQEKYFARLEQVVNNVKDKYPGDDVVLTGHSLGGGFAQVVAARTQTPALVFSAPGMWYSARRFGIVNKWGFGLQSAKRNVMVIMPERDLVPQVDLQAGITQYIECRNQNGGAESPVSCHAVKKTACELWRVCGDLHHRDFRLTCSAYTTKAQLENQFFYQRNLY